MAQLTVSPTNLSEARAALAGWSSVKIGNNTELRDLGTHVVATLHGHHIVRYTEEAVEATFAGYVTKTTADRLNGLVSVPCNIKGGEGYIDGEEVMASEWVQVG